MNSLLPKELRGRTFVDKDNHVGVCFTDSGIEFFDPETDQVKDFFNFITAEEIEL